MLPMKSKKAEILCIACRKAHGKVCPRELRRRKRAAIAAAKFMAIVDAAKAELCKRRSEQRMAGSREGWRGILASNNREGDLPAPCLRQKRQILGIYVGVR